MRLKINPCFLRADRPAEESRFLFLLEEAYDGMTVPKNLKSRAKLERIITVFMDAKGDTLWRLSHCSAPMEKDNADNEPWTDEEDSLYF